MAPTNPKWIPYPFDEPTLIEVPVTTERDTIPAPPPPFEYIDIDVDFFPEYWDEQKKEKARQPS
jgi:hypothetical protein